MIAFKPLSYKDREELNKALRSNADGMSVLQVDRRDTSFAGTRSVLDPASDVVTDDEVVDAIKSVPCHYACDRMEN